MGLGTFSRKIILFVALVLACAMYIHLNTLSSFADERLSKTLDQQLEFKATNAWWKENTSSINCHAKKSVSLRVQPPMTMFTYEQEEDTIVSGSIINNADDPSAGGFFEANMRESMLQVLKDHPGAIVFDIGANIGLHTVFFANAGYEVHAFEPYRATFEILACSVAANNFTKVHLNNFGLGTNSNTTCITESYGNRGHATVQENTTCPPAQTIQVHRLDKYMEAYNVHPFLVKIDIEGFEYFALKTVKERFKANPPAHIFSEFYPDNMQNVNVDPKEYLDLLLDMGYNSRHRNAVRFSFQTLPSELVQEILKHLPINPSILRKAAYASKSDFAPYILHDHVFAKQHFLFQLQSSSSTSCLSETSSTSSSTTTTTTTTNIWEFLDSHEIHHSTWLSLPHTYKIAIYAEILSRERWHRSDEPMDLSKNLFYCLRWNLPPQTALHVITQIRARYPRFDFTVHKNRPLRWSCRMGHTDVVEYLLKDPAVNPADEECLGLHWACENRNIEVVKVLLRDSRVDPTYRDNFPIKISAQEGLLEIVEILLGEEFGGGGGGGAGAGADGGGRRGGIVDPSAQDNFACRLASQNGHTEVVRRLLLDPRVDPSASNNYAIILASRNGHYETVELLLKDPRVDPAGNANEPIVDASRGGHVSVVKALLADSRVDPSARGNDALKFAGARKHFEVILLLLKDPRVNPATGNQVALTSAVEAGRVDVVKALLEHPRNRAIRINWNHYEPVKKAVEGEQWEMARMFLMRSKKTFTRDVSSMSVDDLKRAIEDLV
ncbi:hypothetical protein BDR26DRAFT_891167 [Obelidium mucronatum]|nr:hypothetical protein BDR26DRAFT_891167 [Obelidium mucronatum]